MNLEKHEEKETSWRKSGARHKMSLTLKCKFKETLGFAEAKEGTDRGLKFLST